MMIRNFGRATQRVTGPWHLASFASQADEVSPDDVNWTSPGNVTAIDGSRATVTLNASFPNSAMLMGYGFDEDFALDGIPTDAFDFQCEVELVNMISTDASSITLTMLRLQKSGVSTPIASQGNGAAPGTVLPTSGTSYNYVGGTAYWGETIDRNFFVVNSGVDLGGVRLFKRSANSPTIGVDAIRMRSIYTRFL